jgi:hypothetical protein
MGAQVVSFLNWSHRAAPQPVADWSQQELAEFYRVEGALIRAGLSIETDRGLSDEGDPWFVFLRAEDGEVVVHFARVDGEYLIAGPAYEKVSRGHDFNALVRAMIAQHPLIQPQERGGNILLHPAAILVAIVGTAFFKTGEAKAMDNDHRPGRKPAAAAADKQAAVTPASAPTDHIYIDANQALTIMAGALFAMEPRFDRQAQLAGSRDVQAGGVIARLDLHAANLSDADSFRLEGLKTDASHPTALAAAQAPALLAITTMLDQVSNAAHTGQMSGSQAQFESAAPVLPATSTGDVQPIVYMALELRSGLITGGQSIQFLREIAGGFEKIAVVTVDKIPEAIADLIAHGANFAVGAVMTGPEAFVVAPEAFAPVAAPPAVDEPHKGVDPGVVQTQQPDTAIDTSAAPPPVVTPPPSVGVDAGKALAQSLIDYFIAHVPHAEVMTSGLEVVFYDSRVFDHADVLNHVDALTFHFSDGSSISLVGEHSTLYHDLG